jgi:hypothetical protein
VRISELRSEIRNGKREYGSPVARILEAAISIADADSDDDRAWHRSWMRLRKTLLDLGWAPPSDPEAGLRPWADTVDDRGRQDG